MLLRHKLSKATLLLLHLAAQGQVWRNKEGKWVASTPHASRQVQDRINGLIGKGLLSATFEKNFPEVTEDGWAYVKQFPISDVLGIKKIT